MQPFLSDSAKYVAYKVSTWYSKLLFSKGVKNLAYKEIDTTNLIEIDSVSSYIEHIRRIKESADGTSTELYFRGQETEFWDIEPSIFRDDMLSIEN